jgi:hypothetical protein
MLILGLVLLVIGFIADVAILQTIGIILLIVGAVLWILDRWDARLAAVGTTGSAPACHRCSDEDAVQDVVSMSGHLPSAREDLRGWLLTWVPELVKRRARWAGGRRPLVKVAICIRYGR